MYIQWIVQKQKHLDLTERWYLTLGAIFNFHHVQRSQTLLWGEPVKSNSDSSKMASQAFTGGVSHLPWNTNKEQTKTLHEKISMDSSPLSSYIHGRFQARILESVVISFSREPSGPGDRTQVYLNCRQTPYCLSHQGNLERYLPTNICEE